MLHRLDVRQYQRSNTLCIILYNRLFHVVIEGSFTVALVTQARDEADVVQCQLAVLFAQAGVTDTIKGALTDYVVALIQSTQTGTLHDCVGKDRGSGLFQIVRGNIREVDNLIPHAALLILVRQYRIHEALIDEAQLILLLRVGIGQ